MLFTLNVEYANGVDSFRDFRVSIDSEVRNAFNQDLEAVKSHYIFGDSEYLIQEFAKKGGVIGTNPLGSNGKLKKNSARYIQIGISIVFGAFLAYLFRH